VKKLLKSHRITGGAAKIYKKSQAIRNRPVSRRRRMKGIEWAEKTEGEETWIFGFLAPISAREKAK